MTWGLFALPIGFTAAAVVSGVPALAGVATFLAALYAWVWLRYRPREFVVEPDRIEVRWPWRRQSIDRRGITNARVMTFFDLRAHVGIGLRVGAEGLWGGFGLLWTRRRGLVQMYVSRTDRMVWIDRGVKRPWLITPVDPHRFVEALGFCRTSADTFHTI